MKISILKPDHLGDLILSAPAINKLTSLGHDITLIISKNADFLARYLFPNAKIKYATFSHLSRTNEVNDLNSVFEAIDETEMFVSLRRDPQIEELIFSKINKRNSLLIENSLTTHETLLQANCIKPLSGTYLPVDFFATYNNQIKPWPKHIRKVGFVISAGFFNNSLPVIRWYEFAKYIIETFDAEISIIGGPNERNDSIVLKSLIGKASLIEGAKDIDQFLIKVSPLDLIIATDSGSAHMCSLSGVPILSLFGASPHERYQPIGRYNKVIRHVFNCSPCPQFEVQKVNRCISKECLNSIVVKDIEKSILNTP